MKRSNFPVVQWLYLTAKKMHCVTVLFNFSSLTSEQYTLFLYYTVFLQTLLFKKFNIIDTTAVPV